jgi:hypothetical protein
MNTPDDSKKPVSTPPPAGPVVRKLRFDAAHTAVRQPLYLAMRRDRPDRRS